MLNKNILVISFSILSSLFFVSCGNEANDNNTDKEIQLPENIKNFMPYNLSEYGYNMELYIPDSTIGIPEVNMTDWGAIQIKVGKNYGVEITYGDGDINMLKEDLHLSDVFKSEILKEDSLGVVYKQEIPDANIIKYHFMVVKKFGADAFEIKDLIEEDYLKPDIEKMFESAKTLNKVELNTSDNNKKEA